MGGRGGGRGGGGVIIIKNKTKNYKVINIICCTFMYPRHNRDEFLFLKLNSHKIEFLFLKLNSHKISEI